MNYRLLWVALLAPLVIACGSPETTEAYIKLAPDPLPKESFENPPTAELPPGSLVIKPENMARFYDHPGEAGYFAFGNQYGFESLSFILTETHPRGGPQLHTHGYEEAHVVLSGKMDYIIGQERFTATAPYIARVPADTPHTFVNSGTTPLNLIGVFSTTEPDYEPIGPNPLVAEIEAPR
jgi:mannose-6-phosphate isomerase-like protein (cupin superfamily)